MPKAHDSDKEKGEKYETLFMADIIGIAQTRLSGEIYDANDYFLNLIGYSREELQAGKINWYTITAPEFRDLSLQVRDELDSKQGVAFEKEYIHKDGHRVPVLVGVTRFANGDLITLVQDLSSRKETEARTQRLEQSESFLSAILENIPNMVFVKSAEDLKFVLFNRAGEELIGVPRSEMIGRSDFDFFPRDQAEFFIQNDRKVLKDGSLIDIPEEEISTQQGVRVLHTRKIPIFREDGTAEYLLGISEDITEKRLLEVQRAALYQEQVARREAEARMRQMTLLADISSVLSETFDQDKVLKLFSRQVVRSMADICIVDLLNEENLDIELGEIAGKEPQEEVAVRKWRMQHPFRWDSQTGVPHVMRTGVSEIENNSDVSAHIRESFNQEAAGDVPVHAQSFMITPIRIHETRPVGTVTLVSTTPGRRFTAVDLVCCEEISRRLGTALENCRLYQSSLEASRTKSAFLANMSHEIRTPLGAMLGFADVLGEDESLSEDQKSLVEIIRRNGHQLLRIVDEILDLSKVESDKIEIESVRFNLKDLLTDIVKLCEGQCLDKGVKLTLVTENLPEWIQSDPTRIRQILLNVVGNAVKFTDEGEVEIKAILKSSQGRRRILEFQVRDTGIGISKEQRSSLFQPFTQADSSTTRRYGGTGLGLVLARRLARLLEGDVVLDFSRPGEGSRFSITMVVEEVEAQPEIAAKNSKEQNRNLDRLGSVLVVDDVPDNRALLVRYLEKLGLRKNQIDIAENGQQAIERALAKRYQLILMDVQMPIMDGIQALHRLRDKRYKGRIVALTAHAMKGDEEKCLAEGFDGYLRKPLRRDDLKKVLMSSVH